MVDHAPAAYVEKATRSLHLAEGLQVEHALRVAVQARRTNEVVRLSEQLVELNELIVPLLRGPVRSPVCVNDFLYAESSESSRYCHAYFTEAKNAYD